MSGIFSLVRPAALRVLGSLVGVLVLLLEIQMILQAERGQMDTDWWTHLVLVPWDSMMPSVPAAFPALLHWSWRAPDGCIASSHPAQRWIAQFIHYKADRSCTFGFRP